LVFIYPGESLFSIKLLENLIMRGILEESTEQSEVYPSFSPFLKSEEGDSKGQSPFVMIKQYHFSKIIFDEIRSIDKF